MSKDEKKFKILVTIPDVKLNVIDKIATIIRHDTYPRDEFLSLCEDIDAIYSVYPNQLDKEFLDRAPKLKVISTFSAGYTHIDIEECKKRKIKVGYMSGKDAPSTEVVAELGVALLLATARRFPEAMEEAKAEFKTKWHAYLLAGKQIEGSTIGKAEYVSFDDLIRDSDFLIITASETPKTIGKFDLGVLEKMKKGSILINISRGCIIKSMDLYQVLKNGHLFAAGLDVTDPEPLPYDHPLFELKNCLILPHVGASTTYARDRLNEMTEENIYNGLMGLPMPIPLME